MKQTMNKKQINKLKKDHIILCGLENDDVKCIEKGKICCYSCDICGCEGCCEWLKWGGDCDSVIIIPNN